MKFKYLIAALALASCTASAPAFAGKYGTSYGGSRSSYSRSYSAPSRPAPVIHRNVTVNKTTIVHSGGGYGGGSNGLLTGVILGNMMNHSAPVQPVIMQPAMAPQAAPVYAEPQVVSGFGNNAAPVVVQEAPEGHIFLYVLLWVTLIGGAIAVWRYAAKQHKA